MFSLFKLSAQILVQVALSLQLYAFLLAVLPNSTAADPIFFRSNTYQMTFKTSFFNSNANFSPEGGTFEQLGNDKYFKTLNLGLLWDLVLSKRTAWRLGLTGAWAESSDGSFIRKNSALTELLLGYQYFLFAKPIKAKPEVAVIYPIKKVEKGTDEVTLSEGVVVVKLGVWLQKKWLSLYNYGYFGYAYRSDGRSSLAECTLGIKKKFKGIGLGAEISGFQSVTEDEYTNSPTQRLAITDAVNGGSRKFHSLNPSLLTSKAYVVVKINRSLSLKGSYWVDFQGKSIGKGNTIYFDLVWNLGTLRQKLNKSLHKKRQSDTLERFNIEATEYDESLFE